MNQLKKLFLFFAAATILLSACAPSAPSPVNTVLPGVDLTKSIQDFNAWYTKTVNQQADLQVNVLAFDGVYSKYYSTMSALVANNANCYVNVKNTEQPLLEATFNPNQDQGTLINALVTNTIGGELATSICAEGNEKIANFVISGRQEVYDAYIKMQESAVFFVRDLNNTIPVKVGNDFLQTYGDPNIAEQKMRDAGIPGLTDFQFPPNEQLFYVMPGNKEICDYYITGAFKQYLPPPILNKFYGHDESLMRRYGAQWTPPLGGSNGSCKLFAQAALDQIMTPIMNQNASNAINTGVDNGNEIPTVTP